MIAGSSLILACSYLFRFIVCCWIARDCGKFFFLPENRTISPQKWEGTEKRVEGKENVKRVKNKGWMKGTRERQTDRQTEKERKRKRRKKKRKNIGNKGKDGGGGCNNAGIRRCSAAIYQAKREVHRIMFTPRFSTLGPWVETPALHTVLMYRHRNSCARAYICTLVYTRRHTFPETLELRTIKRWPIGIATWPLLSAFTIAHPL